MSLKKHLPILLTACLLFFAQSTFAQQKKKKSETPSDFKSHLWYGGGILLGFSGGGGGSVFQFGLAPMVGYKIVEPLSVGPVISAAFTSYKQSGFKSVGLFDFDAGAFIRYRVYQGFFVHGELTNEWYQNPIFYTNGTTEKVSESRFNQRLGAGYNFNAGRGGAGSEIAILYNFAIANDLETWENPWVYRFSFTFNF